MLTSAWERRSPHSCFWRRCVPAWPGPCPQSSQISLWLISTLQKSSVAFLQRNEATDCGNQSLIVCACACARANMAACVCQCERAACELCVVPSLPPLRQQIAVVPYWNKGAAPFSFPSFFFFFSRTFVFQLGARPPLIMLPRGFHRDGARPPESRAVGSAECSIDRQQEPECWRAPSDSPSRQRLQGKP